MFERRNIQLTNMDHLAQDLQRSIPNLPELTDTILSLIEPDLLGQISDLSGNRNILKTELKAVSADGKVSNKIVNKIASILPNVRLPNVNGLFNIIANAARSTGRQLPRLDGIRGLFTTLLPKDFVFSDIGDLLRANAVIMDAVEANRCIRCRVLSDILQSKKMCSVCGNSCILC